MLKDVKRIRCPICNKGHIADVPCGTKFLVFDINKLQPNELLNKVILKCPKGAHYAALEIK